MAVRADSFERLLGSYYHRLLSRRHTAMLVALVSLFGVRPLFGDVGFAPILFSIALIILMLVSLYTVQLDESAGDRVTFAARKTKPTRVVWLLAIPAVAERIAVGSSRSPFIVISGLIFWLLFFIYIIWNELRVVLRQKEVTGETISLSISIYLLMGLTWGVFYMVLFYLQPHAFNFGGAPPSNTHSVAQVFSVLIYFSLTTISTVGFGDITPVTLQARYTAVAEGITGQFYLAILVARLMGLYMSRIASNEPGSQKRGSEAEKQTGANI
jgi:hypothetical protein